MKTIAVRNNKGGVGKSTMTSHLAAGLAIHGNRVGIIDADSQGHCSVIMGVEATNALYDVMVNGTALSESVYYFTPDAYSVPDYPSKGELFLLPGSHKTYRIESELEPRSAFAFLDMVEKFGAEFNLDYLLVDTSPSFGAFDALVHMATDGYIYVTEVNSLSFHGVESIMQDAEFFIKDRRRYLNRDGAVLGIIPNKLRANAKLHRRNIEALADGFPGLVWPPVTLRVIWEEAAQVNKLVYTYMPTGTEARDAWQLVGCLEQRISEVWQVNAKL